MRHIFRVRVGPAAFRIGSDWRAPIAALSDLYRDYPEPDDGIAQYNVRLSARRPWRRLVRPAVTIGGDYMIPDALPLPARLGLLAAEMGMNLQLALAERRYLLLHAATVERAGRAVLMTGVSGSGKSTLAALMMADGWRMLGDEFALIDPATGLVHALPRPISLKNASIDIVGRALPAGRFGPPQMGTPKGDVRHLVPDAAALGAMDVPARIVAILFPGFGHVAAERPVPPAEVFVRLTQASTNYVAMGERGFEALTRLVRQVPASAIDYPDTDTALAQVRSAWERAA